MSEALSITYLTSYDPFSTISGGEINTRELALEMAFRGHDVTIVHSHVPRFIDVFREGVRCYGVPNSPLPYISGWTADREVLEFLRRFGRNSRGDLLEARGVGYGHAFSHKGLNWCSRIFHSVDVRFEEIRALPRIDKALYAPMYFAMVYNERVCVKTANWIVVDTESVGHRLEETYPAVSSKWCALPPAIPRRWEQREDSPYDAFHFLFIGAGSRRDLGLFLAALRLLTFKGRRVSATVLRNGRGRYVRLATDWRLNVRFAHSVSESELRAEYARSCAFVLPSVREAYCKPVVEAAFHGTPSIVSDLPAVREFVTDGVTGIVVKSSDPIVWANALDALSEDRVLRSHLGAKAKTRATELYSAKRIGDLTEAVYRRILSG